MLKRDHHPCDTFRIEKKGIQPKNPWVKNKKNKCKHRSGGQNGADQNPEQGG